MRIARTIASLLVAFSAYSVAAEDSVRERFRTAAAHNPDIAIQLIRDGLVRSEREFEDGGTPLCDAAQGKSADSFDVALELITNGARPDQQCEGGFTPLHFASTAGNLAIIDLLVRHGADISADGPGPDAVDTPLYRALAEGHARVAGYLERQGATISSEVRESIESLGRVMKAINSIGPSPFPAGSPEDAQWEALMAIEIFEEYDRNAADPLVVRTMKELKHLLETNPKPSDMSQPEWLALHTAAAKDAVLQEVR